MERICREVGESLSVPVGVIGVGRIGTPLVARLIAAGHEVIATDIRVSLRETAEREGARWASDARGVASASSVVFTVLPGSAELGELMLGSGSPLEHMGGGAVWIDMTSASIEVGRQCARAARRFGVGYLDAPIGGGVAAIREGTATLYVGGESEVLEAVEGLLAAFASCVHHVGDSGSGYLAKLLINFLWFGQVGLTTEALLLARHHGLAPDRMRTLLHGSAGDGAFVARHLPALLSGDYLREFGLDRCVEELEAVERAAERADLPHALATAVADLHRAALRRYGPVDGELLGAAWLEEQAGARLRAESDDPGAA